MCWLGCVVNILGEMNGFRLHVHLEGMGLAVLSWWK